MDLSLIREYITFPFSILHLDFLMRILLACICGLFIGLERRTRMKEAGPRTHFIIALTSSLITVISKYGFIDAALLGGSEMVRVDPARTAVAVVTAISFIGAGVIFTKKNNIVGLTTAAGMWATVGVGMAFGIGFYVEAFAVTFILLLMQYISHAANHHFTRRVAAKHAKTKEVWQGEQESVKLIFATDDVINVLNNVENALGHLGFIIQARRWQYQNGQLEITMNVMSPERGSHADLANCLLGLANIQSVRVEAKPPER